MGHPRVEASAAGVRGLVRKAARALLFSIPGFVAGLVMWAAQVTPEDAQRHLAVWVAWLLHRWPAWLTDRRIVVGFGLLVAAFYAYVSRSALRRIWFLARKLRFRWPFYVGESEEAADYRVQLARIQMEFAEKEAAWTVKQKGHLSLGAQLRDQKKALKSEVATLLALTENAPTVEPTTPDERRLQLEAVSRTLDRYRDSLEDLGIRVARGDADNNLPGARKDGDRLIAPARACIHHDGVTLGKSRVTVFDGGHGEAAGSRHPDWSQERYELYVYIRSHELHLEHFVDALNEQIKTLDPTRIAAATDKAKFEAQSRAETQKRLDAAQSALTEARYNLRRGSEQFRYGRVLIAPEAQNTIEFAAMRAGLQRVASSRERLRAAVSNVWTNGILQMATNVDSDSPLSWLLWCFREHPRAFYTRAVGMFAETLDVTSDDPRPYVQATYITYRNWRTWTLRLVAMLGRTPQELPDYAEWRAADTEFLHALRGELSTALMATARTAIAEYDSQHPLEPLPPLPSISSDERERYEATIAELQALVTEKDRRLAAGESASLPPMKSLDLRIRESEAFIAAHWPQGWTGNPQIFRPRGGA